MTTLTDQQFIAKYFAPFDGPTQSGKVLTDGDVVSASIGMKPPRAETVEVYNGQLLCTTWRKSADVWAEDGSYTQSWDEYRDTLKNIPNN